MATTNRSVWSGTIAFGLVSMDAKLYKAVDSHGVGFSQFCATHMEPVGYRKYCKGHDETLAPADILKGTLRDGKPIIVNDDDLDQLPVPSTKEIAITEFVPLSDVLNPVIVKETYFVGSKSSKAFHLLKRTLQDTGTAAIAKVNLRDGREQICALTVHGDDVLLSKLAWADEVRDASSLHTDADVSDAELAMAKMIVSNMTVGSLDCSKYSDTYTNALKDLLDAKAAGTELPIATPVAKAGVVDLMAALKASVEATKAA